MFNFKYFRNKIYFVMSPCYRRIMSLVDEIIDIRNMLIKTINLLNNLNSKLDTQVELYTEQLHVANAGIGFGDNFKYYFINHNMPEIIKKLKIELDEISISVIDNKIEHFLNLPLDFSKYAYNCRYKNRDILYTNDELKENNEFISQLPWLREKYKGDFDVMVPEVFWYHHGLKFLNNKYLQYIADKDFIDLGAETGDSAIVLSDYNPNKIYSFEIEDKFKNTYYNNIVANNLDVSKFIFLNYGISDKKKNITVSDKNDIRNITKNNLVVGGNRIIHITSLDDYFFNYKNIGLIKMDIEGAEFDAIKGAETIIRLNKPIMVISIYHTPKEFFELKPLISSWELGYKFLIRNLNFYRYCELETTLICVPTI